MAVEVKATKKYVAFNFHYLDHQKILIEKHVKSKRFKYQNLAIKRVKHNEVIKILTLSIYF